ncbi:MAG: phosphotransferase family protein [Sphingomonadaceae bacterium]|uniref:phosphotransferase family protein n=1 Tax=Thermaurantiacus sp. TaxID=2820283 RepID=UPI00298EF505|nr:phosphotransferase family protein [Thermaurantiacus sp.]MCS6986708.1 phosphotransferase family protein [Sphingomonadaceae bacterium]MDW8414029.1 phosphotransferase family protein [Thermaurantiacus sp.]
MASSRPDAERRAARSNPLDPAGPDGRASLERLLAQALGQAVRVLRVTALSGGASSLTWAVDAEASGAARRFILQRAATDAHGLPRGLQAEVMRRAGRLGVPVPPVIAVTSPDHPLGEAVVTGFVDGEALAPRWLRQPEYAAARARLVEDCANALARLHAAPLQYWQGLPLSGGSGEELLHQQFETYRRIGVDVPAFDLAFAWLEPRMPRDPPSVLVHGDFRSGNFLVSHAGLAAVLDWEIPHFSVPAEDLGWLCAQAWRFGQWRLPVGGFATREALLQAYRAAGGRIDPEELHVWEVFANLRWGMSCLVLADDHVSGRVPSVERAAIGRRVSEVAADLVHIIAFGEL